MKKRRDWAPAAISAAVAAAAVVAIYEGEAYLTRSDPGLEAERREAGHPAANVDLLGPRSCLNMLEQAAMSNDPKAYWGVRRQVGEVHPGMRAPPEAGPSRDPLFDVYMALTSEAQLFEADLAQSFGPEEAERIWQAMRCTESVGVKL
jgi:hypothetical protein